MKIIELAKARRAEVDALRTEIMDLREKSSKADALIVEVEKVKSYLPSSAKSLLDEYAKAKPKKK